MNDSFIIKKNFNFFIIILRIILKQFDNLNKCRLCLLYGYKYSIFSKKTHNFLGLILSLVSNKLNPEKIRNSCKVRPSKIIFDKNDKELFIFDRPIPDFYFHLRDQFSTFHKVPSYLKVDKQSYLQNKIFSNKDLLSCEKSDLFNLIKKYLDSQIELKKNYGVKVSVSEFLDRPLSFITKRVKMDNLPSIFQQRIVPITKKIDPLILVPSIIEPWPIIKENIMLFHDLSPVEFRKAPFLHDLFYMLFKYEFYGNRKRNHNSIFKTIFKSLKKIDNGQEKDIENNELFSLVKLIHNVVKPHEFIDAYILMIIFHSYVKYEATGKFNNSSAKRRFELALSRHAEIFKLTLC